MAKLKFNKVIAIVRVVSEPQVQTFGSGAVKASVRAVISESKKNKDGSWADKPVWVELQAWNRPSFALAENLGNQVGKGSVIHVEGKLEYEEWEDKNGGGKRSKLFIVVDGFQLLEGPKAAPESRPAESNDGFGSSGDDNGDIPF